MNKTIDWIVARLSEASTWRGLIGIATAAGATLQPDQAAAIISAGLALMGLVNVFRKQPESPDAK